MNYLDFFPLESHDYISKLRLKHPCILRCVNPRKRKLGDFRVRGSRISISVNGDLSKDEFLFVFLHEMAHFIIYKKHGSKVFPHGIEWKNQFGVLLVESLPYFKESYRDEILSFSKKPMASLSPRSTLSLLFSSKLSVSKSENFKLSLAEIPNGDYFILNKTVFRKEKLLRTRYLCKREVDQKLFTIHKTAEIELYEK